MSKSVPVPVNRNPERDNDSGHHPWQQLRREIDQVFERFSHNDWFPALFGRDEAEPVTFWDSGFPLRPDVDVEEMKKKYRISAELPGLDESDIEVTLRDDVLLIRGEKKETRESDEGDYRMTERRYGRFQRSFVMPRDAVGEEIKAKFSKGVLTIDIPRSADSGTAQKRIDIKAA